MSMTRSPLLTSNAFIRTLSAFTHFSVGVQIANVSCPVIECRQTYNMPTPCATRRRLEWNTIPFMSLQLWLKTSILVNGPFSCKTAQPIWFQHRYAGRYCSRSPYNVKSKIQLPRMPNDRMQFMSCFPSNLIWIYSWSSVWNAARWLTPRTPNTGPRGQHTDRHSTVLPLKSVSGCFVVCVIVFYFEGKHMGNILSECNNATCATR